MNILILNKDLPVFPGWISVEYLHTINLAHLAEQVGLVSMAHTAEQAGKIKALSDEGVRLFLWRSPFIDGSPLTAAQPISSLRLSLRKMYHWVRAGLKRPQDTLVEDYSFRNLAPSLLNALSETEWQTLIVVQSSAARWIDYTPKSLVSVLVMHDIRALVYERRARMERSLFRRLSYTLEARKYYRFERYYCQKYELIVTVSENDADWVRQHYAPKQVVAVPLPLDSQYFAPLAVDTTAVSAPRIVFTGTMNYPPNIDAVCYFAYDIFPHILKEVPNAEFWIVGRDPGAEVLELAELPGVRITGAVSDIREYMAAATVIVVPLRFGSGMRTKILEAWAMQKCVVSSTIGAEGLDYTDGENLLIADEALTFARQIVTAIQEEALRDRLRMRGRQIVIEQHAPEQLAKRYYEAISSVAEDKRRT